MCICLNEVEGEDDVEVDDHLTSFDHVHNDNHIIQSRHGREYYTTKVIKLQ